MKDYLTNLKFPIKDLDLFISQCEEFFPFLCAENKKSNLTRITSEEDFWIKHVVDSLLLLKFKPELAEQSFQIADLGCGAGFPALILAMALPESNITAIDSIGKKTEFVSRAGEHLGIKKLKVIKGRGRELAAKPEWGGLFDIITARAVAETKKIFREVRRLLKPNGQIILYKTPDVAEKEICEVRKSFGFDWQISQIYTLPENKGTRCFISGEKD